MPQCSSTCNSSTEPALHTDIQAALQVQKVNREVAWQQIKASRSVVHMLLGSALQAELLALRIAMIAHNTACEALEMLAIASSR